MGRKKVSKEEGEHEVNLTITIAKATETDFDAINDNQRRKGKVVEAPKAQSYFHCSYKLLPDDKESVKTDVVTFGAAAKLYTEHDSRVLRTWIDGDKTWVAWTNTHKVRVTKDVLLKMFSHSLELKIWDAKEKVSPRARFDRPKAFKLPPVRGNEESEIENVKKLIEKQLEERIAAIEKRGHCQTTGARNRRNTMHHNSNEFKDRKEGRHRASTFGQNETSSRKSRSDVPNLTAQLMSSPKLPKQKTASNGEASLGQPIVETAEEAATEAVEEGNKEEKERIHTKDDRGTDPQTAELNSTVKVKVFLDEKKQPQMANLMKLAATGISQNSDDEDNEETDLMIIKQTNSNYGKRSVSTGRSSKSKTISADKKAEAMAAYIKTHGLASVRVKLSALFTGVSSINNRLQNAIGTVEDVVITLSVDTPLLSEPQRKALNPMIIRVLSACNMPSNPLSYEELQERCVQPYISYKLHDEPVHEASGGQHATKIVFNDTRVVLLGIKDKEQLFECFRGPGLEIEVHDRDRDTTQKRDLPTIFGSHADDHMINKASLITSRRTEHNPFSGKEKSWDPYGVARIDLSDLLLGEKIIELSVPIRGCRMPDVVDGRGSGNHSYKIVGKPGSVDGPEDLPIVAANYVEAESELKVKVEIAYPIKTIEEIQSKAVIENPKECPFARLVCIFDYENKELLQNLEKEVMQVNAETLQLMDFPQHVIEAALSTYKLTDSQRSSKTLNIITGFQIIDGKYHIFVLEGLRDLGIKQIWNNLAHVDEDTQYYSSTLYNTEITFQERLYASLDVDLTRVRLHQSVDTIVKLPLLYVRDMVPRLCFQAVLKLHELIHCKRLRDAVRNEMFPTDEMIASLSREFGIPLTMEDVKVTDTTEVPKSSDEELQYLQNVNEKPFKTTRQWTPLQVRNENYEQILKSRMESTNTKNFLEANVARVQQLEPIKRETTITCDPSELPNQKAHNYSIQSLNTTEVTKRKLRDCLSEDPDSRYTYSQKFNSATVLPIDPLVVKKENQIKMQKSWQSPQGFVFPGKKSSRESNKHPKEPDFARLDELKKPWRENVLHSNKLKPTVNRAKFSWQDRSHDFDLLKKPKEYFGEPSPVTIYLAGDTLAKEQRQAADEERKVWERSLVVDNTILKTYRCNTQTELLPKGLKSSSQLARLDDILRNEPRKHALSAPGLRLEKIPALSVALNPTLDPSLSFYERLRIGSEFASSVSKERSFNPGPLENRSWLLEKNKVPTCDYNHGYFIERNGADFALSKAPKDVVYKRPIKPLSGEENTKLLAHEKTAQTTR